MIAELTPTRKNCRGVRLLALAAGLFFWNQAMAAAPTNSSVRSASSQSSQRYLLVFETSRGMQRRSENAIKVVSDLIQSGLNGQMRAGDTLGVWTYNETLSAGQFPLAKWSPETAARIAAQVSLFLSQQKYAKNGDFRAVTPALNSVVHVSEYLTVALISTGENDIIGTAFDTSVNESFKSWREEQQKAKMPLVALFRARRGQFLSYSVTAAPWQIEVPAWPFDPQVAPAKKTNEPPAVAVTPKPAAASTNIGALIFTGRKTKPTDASTETNLVAAAGGSETNAATQSLPAGATNPPVSAKPISEGAALIVERPSPAPSTQTVASRAVLATQLVTAINALSNSNAGVPRSAANSTHLAMTAHRRIPFGGVLMMAVGAASIFGLLFFVLGRASRSRGSESLITTSFGKRQK